MLLCRTYIHVKLLCRFNYLLIKSILIQDKIKDKVGFFMGVFSQILINFKINETNLRKQLTLLIKVTN